MHSSVPLAITLSARCDLGYPIVDTPKSMQRLCLSSYGSTTWDLKVPLIGPTSYQELRITAQPDDCPIENASGLTYGVEHYASINGHRTELWVNQPGSAGAAFRADGHTILLYLVVDPDLNIGIDVGIELDKIVAGLRRVDNDEWHQLTAPP